MSYAQNSDKVISKAIPTVTSEGIVKSWEVEITYSYPAEGYTTTDTPLRKKFNLNEDVMYLNKGVNDFTKAELLSFANLAQFDAVFDSTYTSTVLPPTETRHADFDINSLQ